MSYLLFKKKKKKKKKVLKASIRVPLNHIKVPISHMKEPLSTSKWHTPPVDSGCRHGKMQTYQWI